MERHILTVDVEDNFTYEELVNKQDWQQYESQVVENTLRILFLLKKYKADATFFVVGRVAERHPELVKYVVEDEHEIASHSYWHKSLTTMEMDELEKDIKTSQELMSSLAGKPILGYRAMGFSIPEREAEYYQLLKKYGYLYDSSKKQERDVIFHTIQDGTVYKLYPSAMRLLGKNLIFSGGSVFRLLPTSLIKRGFSQYKRFKQPVMIYVHPWEFNKRQPKRNVPVRQKIMQSPLTFTTERKLTYFLRRYHFVSVKEYLGV